MSTPIRPEEIKKGDRIRKTIDYVAARDGVGGSADTHTYELLDRPVPLPTKPGVYKTKVKGPRSFLTLVNAGLWYDCNGVGIMVDEIAKHYPELTLMRPEAELVREVIYAVQSEYSKFNVTTLVEDCIIVGLNYNVEL